MKKPLLTALLFLCTGWAGFTRSGPSLAALAPPTPPAPLCRNASQRRAAYAAANPFFRLPVPDSDTTAPLLTTEVAAPVGAAGSQKPATPLRQRPLTLRVFNHSARPLSNLVLEWELQVNGVMRQRGRISNLFIGPQHATLVHLPVRQPNGAGDEVFLQVRYRVRQPGSPAAGSRSHPATHSATGKPPAESPGPAAPVLAAEQLLLRAPSGNGLAIPPAGDLTFTDGAGLFTIRSPAIYLEFNKETGWLQHYEVKGCVLLEDTLGFKSNFRVPSAGGDTADPWQQATLDPHLQLFSTSTGSEIVIVRAEYTLPATSCQLHLSYTINAAGEMLVGQRMESDSTQKGWPLPCFGMQWNLPAGYDSIAYYGPGAVDKDTGSTEKSWVGIYRETVGEPIPADIHLREKLTTTGVRWWRITGHDGKGLLITADSSLLSLSAVPAFPQTQLNIDSRQPAAGGAGDQSLLSFRLPYGNYQYAYKVTPVVPARP